MSAYKRILIVDDNLVVQQVLKEFLSQGYAVEVVGTASQALASVVRSIPDLILLDVKMPGVDGLDLLKSLREVGVRAPIFVVTGYDSSEMAEQAVGLGATGYLAKPFDLVHLRRLIGDALGRVPA